MRKSYRTPVIFRISYKKSYFLDHGIHKWSIRVIPKASNKPTVEVLVDDIIINVHTQTVIEPKPSIQGEGKISFSYYKSEGRKKVKATIY